MTFINFLGLLSGVVILRNLQVYLLTLLCRSSFAEKRRIELTPIKPSQIKRERWMMLQGTLIDALFTLPFFLLGILTFTTQSSWMELWIILGVHFVIVEPLYYLYHRILHTRWVYKNHHVYHHLSRITEPNTSFTFTLTERFSYTLMFAIPLLAAALLGYLSVWGFVIYLLVFDFFNSLGHFNFEIFPRWYRNSFLKYVLYTPTFHGKHHTKFKYNFALFVPFWDLVFKTLEPSMKRAKSSGRDKISFAFNEQRNARNSEIYN